ncbi:peptide ABC transporter substrate-binding protein [Actinorhabdospora filicis]|uniref:Peptide ABC transporter substrate-binding protein n=1 Tax=Actinorhabdospora filicis TaxID=1785913 RepID=A0A9W6W4H5_9ACTN|nr:ABC transporter substrate-binding protein [Actinorhabdospora filicis]GLZ79267.1 peptide ABC transporter substrate-binding protein [Actinorhabdospora filicis]
MRRTKLVPALVALALALAATACSPSKQQPTPDSSEDIAADMGPHKQGGSVTIANVTGQTWTCQFNPFNPAVNQTSNGFVYEPLVFVNLLQDQAETPMLASSYEWNAEKTSIVFTVRDGVKWNDGQPLTADDVVFTFELMKKEPATDLYALWTGAGLQSVKGEGNKVTLSFAQAAQPYFFNFANQVVIVPKHVFGAGEAAASPATWANPNPVGTGPFKVDPCTANNIQYVANPSYWQPGKPYIQKVQYPAYLDNGPANQDLASGKAQWGSQFIPGIENFYLNKSPDNHTWSPPVTNVALIPNLDPSHAATSKLEVRQAIASAIDRARVAEIGEGGQQPAANQTGVVLPTFQKYYDGAAVASAGYDKPDAARATSLLSGLGYSPSNPLKLSVITVTGYTDWDASLAVIKQQLAPVGIELTVVDLAQQTYNERLFKGDFDLAYYGQAGGPTPYYELRQILHSANTAPLGTEATTNFERYKNPAVDALFDKYPTADDAGQVQIIKEISGFMLRDVPIIPVTESVDWFQYNTSDIRGWPSPQNPYAQPAAFNIPDVGQVLLHLYSKSAQK